MDFVGKLGALKSPKDVRDYKGVACVAPRDIPREYTQEVPKVKNQGNVGSCVAHSIATVIEYHNKRQGISEEEMSTGYIYGNRINSKHKGEGMIVRDAMLNACKYGDVYRVAFPENVEVPQAIELFNERADWTMVLNGTYHRFTEAYRLDNEYAIKSNILDNGLVVFVIDWYADNKVVNGVLTSTMEQKNNIGGHCMVLYGWNEKGWLIQNSWGELWGDNGRAILPYDYPMKEVWGIVDNYTMHKGYVEIIKPFSSAIGKIIANVLNWLLNLRGSKK